MPGPSKCHLRGPVISALNHICESDGVGSCSPLCLPEAGEDCADAPMNRWPEVKMKSVGGPGQEIHVYERMEEQTGAHARTCWQAPRTMPAL